MSTGFSWAYDFACGRSLEDLLALFNAAGPWSWQLRDGEAYGEYLNVRPLDGVRVRVHAYPQAGGLGTFTGLREKGFSALLEARDGAAARDAIDGVFRTLLEKAGATEITPIEPYD